MSSIATSRYSDWIAAHVEGDGLGQCAQVTEEMAAEFSELTRVRGYYRCPIAGPRSHWWLVTPSGQIVDPTVNQFPSLGVGEYEPWDESRPEPTGRCPNCGGLCYTGETCCTEACHEEYRAFCMNGLI